MRLRNIWMGCFAAIGLVSCASVKTFNMSQVEEQLSQAYQKSEEVSSQTQADLAEKKTLQATLAKGKSASYKEVEPQIKAKLSAMGLHASNMINSRKKMSDARAQVSALSYSRKKISGDAPEYGRVEEYVKDFESAAAEFTTTAGLYSRESNSFAELVAQKKLYFNFDVVEFQKKVEKSLKTAEANSKFMDQELERGEKIVNSFEGEAHTVSGANLQQMQNAAQEHNKKAEHLNTLHRQMNTLAAGQAKIASTSPHWSELQTVVREAERATFSLNELYKEFQNKTDKFRLGVKNAQ